MHPTKIDLSQHTRNCAIGFLQFRLADALDLASQAKQAHWTIKDPNFFALHELFDRIAREVAGYSDLIADRISALGGQAEGTVHAAVQRSTLPKYPLSAVEGSTHLDALSTALATFAASVRQAIDGATRIGDQSTADLFTEISRGADKQLWFVQAHATRRNSRN
jgi:starvation-inducible DNA-binding protein